MYTPFKELESAIDAWLKWWLYLFYFFLHGHSSLLSLYSDVNKQIKFYGATLYFLLLITFFSFPTKYKLSLLRCSPSLLMLSLYFILILDQTENNSSEISILKRKLYHLFYMDNDAASANSSAEYLRFTTR